MYGGRYDKVSVGFDGGGSCQLYFYIVYGNHCLL